MKHIELIHPLHDPTWDRLLSGCENRSIFHSSAWANVLFDSYGYIPLYFRLSEAGGGSALLPVCEIRSALRGRRGVSLPFSDYCEPLASSTAAFREILDYIIAYGRRNGWNRFELKGGKNHLTGVRPSRFFYGHRLLLSEDPQTVFAAFRKNTQRNIRKGANAGVSVRILSSFEAVQEYYRLHCKTRIRQKIPPQPFYFFKNIFKHIICRGAGFIALADVDGAYAAGGVYFFTHRNAYYKYGALDRTYQVANPFYSVMWEAVQWFCRNGYETLCFGRTDPDNNGLLHFKRGWGTDQRTIEYFTYNYGRSTFVGDTHANLECYKRYFSCFPGPVQKLLGHVLYKHIG